jgi:hypothetical protein
MVIDGLETDIHVIGTPGIIKIKTDLGEIVTVSGIVTIERAVPKSVTDGTGIRIDNDTVGRDVIRIVQNLWRGNAVRDHVREGGDDIYIANNQPQHQPDQPFNITTPHRLAAQLQPHLQLLNSSTF